MTGGDWRWWSLTLLDLKLNGQINRCCHLPLWNHLLASTPIRRQHRSLIDTPHLPQRQGGNLSWRIRALGRRNKSRKWQITRGGGGEEKKVLTNHILLMRQFLWCVYINCGFASKVTWSMANWVEILFEMGKIKSPGNLEGQHEQEGGAEVGGNRKRARSCERVWAVTMGKTWVPIKCKRHKGNLQMQGWRGRGGENAFVISGFTVDLDPISQIGPAESFYVWWRWWSK